MCATLATNNGCVCVTTLQLCNPCRSFSSRRSDPTVRQLCRRLPQRALIGFGRARCGACARHDCGAPFRLGAQQPKQHCPLFICSLVRVVVFFGVWCRDHYHVPNWSRARSIHNKLSARKLGEGRAHCACAAKRRSPRAAPLGRARASCFSWCIFGPQITRP